MCDHKFVHRGIGYCDGHWPIPGGGARTRYYADIFFCERCLAVKGVPFSPEHRSNTYEKPRHGATPATADACGVPLEDRPR